VRLDDKEFRAMNNPVRRFFQRMFEYPMFRRLGLVERDRDILEIGCGSGFGALLLSGLSPKSYVGIDVMPEQIALTRQYGLKGYEFLVMDVSDLSRFPDGSKDIVVDFGILHHVQQWERALDECHRVLRKDGRIFMEEPRAVFLEWWDRLLHWNHPRDTRFDLVRLEERLAELGFVLERRIDLLVFGIYAARKA
jgi:ubiquinone/menaquinone biosynthesis C-methylase UbiE